MPLAPPTTMGTCSSMITAPTPMAAALQIAARVAKTKAPAAIVATTIAPATARMIALSQEQWKQQH